MRRERLPAPTAPAPCRCAARVLAAALAGGYTLAAAAPTGADVAPVRAAAAAASAAAPAAGDATRVIEDDRVRIEETLQRGQVRRLVVRSKASGVATYEILVAPPGRDPTQDRSGAGQRVWPVLSF